MCLAERGSRWSGIHNGWIRHARPNTSRGVSEKEKFGQRNVAAADASIRPAISTSAARIPGVPAGGQSCLRAAQLRARPRQSSRINDHLRIAPSKSYIYFKISFGRQKPVCIKESRDARRGVVTRISVSRPPRPVLCRKLCRPRPASTKIPTMERVGHPLG